MTDMFYTAITTDDTDVHLIEEDIETVRRKVSTESIKWLVTNDGRYVRTTHVVALWVPTKEEVDNYLA